MIDSHVVFVLGPYRSGTSVTARVISNLGVYFGDNENLIPADVRNPSGYFERDELNNSNKAYIENTGGSLENPGEPEHIRDHGDCTILQACDLKWMSRSTYTGIKDPRMCATLAAWFKAGVFEPKRCRIIQIKRKREAIVKSAVAHDHVARYCDEDPRRIGDMSTRYITLSEWQTRHAPCPVFTINYEELILNPLKQTNEIAAFLGIIDRKLIKQASQSIGKKRAQSRLKFRNWLIEFRFYIGAQKNKLFSIFRRNT